MSVAPVPEGLTRPVRDEEVACYAEHGVVHLPGLLDPVWLAEAERVFGLVFGEGRAEGLNELNASELAPMLRAMGYIRGSHRWPIHAANGFVTRQPMPGSPEKPLPDIEGHEEDYDIQWVECQPGDAIVHHVRTVHGSTGNTTDRPRRAVSLRYLGEDCRYHPREGTPPDSQKSEHLSPGDPMASPEFPLVWTRDEGYLPEPVTG